MLLIVEHNRNHRLLLEEELSSAGHATVSACTARQAVDLLTVSTPDLVLLDGYFCGTDGPELLRKLSEGRRQCPVVVYTADATFHNRHATQFVDAVVLKSSNLTRLVDVIRHVLARRRSRSTAHHPEPVAHAMTGA